MIKLFTSIARLARSIVEARRERKRRKCAAVKERDNELDAAAARAAGVEASKKQEDAYRNQRELTHRP